MDESPIILSLGAGVQSTAVLLMAERGVIERPVEAIFADTGWEPQATYDHLEWLKGQTSIPITTVNAGNLRDDAMASVSSAWMPLHVKNLQGKSGMLRRQCTSNYKIIPIRRRVREIRTEMKAKQVVQWMGISIDEWQRMRESNVKYIRNGYPLIDRRLSRQDCELWLERNGYPVPPKSSCIGCPFHNDAYWAEMKRTRPDEFANAVEFDETIRDRRGRGFESFLHRQLIPLSAVDLRTPADKGQLSFLDECEGVCGV